MRKALLLALSASLFLSAETKYQHPPKAIQQVLDAPATPEMIVSPARNAAVLVEFRRYPPIAELARPVLRLAGYRINPRTNGPHLPMTWTRASFMRLPAGKETPIVLPAGVKGSGMPRWSRDGRSFAFSAYTEDGFQLWVGSSATGAVRRVPAIRLNASIYPQPFQWAPDGKSVLAFTIPANRGPAPAADAAPAGPATQEGSGKSGPIRTYEDLLKNAHDEAVFDYYATAQLASIDIATGKAAPVGKPAVYDDARLSPDGKHILVARIHKPYSYLLPASDFPTDVEIVDLAGKVEHKVASIPLQDKVPMDGVITEPRNYYWQPSAPATLLWAEALDGGNPRNKAEFRDRVMKLAAPFQGAPVEVLKTEQRYMGTQAAEKSGLAFVRDYDRDKRWVRTFLIDLDHPEQERKLLWSLSRQDRYNDPGQPVMRDRGILMSGDWVYLHGLGASREGDRPFLNRYNVKTGQAEPLFRSGAKSYESFVALLDDEGKKFVTRRESPADPPNYHVRTAGATESAALTRYPDPAPQLRGITKQLVKYKRPDGVDLSFTLYLPPNYQPGTRLPTVVWAYPLEYNDPATAGQVTGSTQRFTSIIGMSHLFFLLEGYAVLDNAAMPVVGTPEKVNDTYVDQIVADAKAAIDKAAEIGVTDPNRVGVGGHSYGAFMTANLLAHCDLFKAGIARSGAYNRTLTPFGFQSERRTFWEAPDLYMKMSPFVHADKIHTPILFIHGEADDNTGTFPIQSERMYAAVRGNGGTARLVMLPAEAHGYRARESVEHTLYEMISWFDKYVKNANQQQTSVH